MEIYVKRGVRSDLSRIFEVSRAAVSEALRFKSHSVLGRTIRSSAMNNMRGFILNY